MRLAKIRLARLFWIRAHRILVGVSKRVDAVKSYTFWKRIAYLEKLRDEE